MHADEEQPVPAPLNDDVLMFISQALSPPDLLACRMVCRHWRSAMAKSVHSATWAILSSLEASMQVLHAIMATFLECSSICMVMPLDPLLLKSHCQGALNQLTQACPQLHSISIRGPAVIQFVLAPGISLEAALLSLPAASTQLRSLSITGHLANSVYRELNSVLPHVAHSLTQLNISGVHQWSRAMTSEQLLALPDLLPRLEHLSFPFILEEGDSLRAWYSALAGLSRAAHLQKLAIEGGLCHTPGMAEAVASWRALPLLRELQVEITELTHPLDTEDQWMAMYVDPQLLQADIWVGVLPQLSQLTSLTLVTDSVPQALWCDLASCSWLHRLSLQHTAWALDFDISACQFKLGGLQSLQLCLGDADLAVLCSLPSLHTSLHTLDLELKGMDYGPVPAANFGLVLEPGWDAGQIGHSSNSLIRLPAAEATEDVAEGMTGSVAEGVRQLPRPVVPATGLAALAGFGALRDFKCDSKSLCLTEEALSALAASWPLLESFSFKGPAKVYCGQGLMLFKQLASLSLLSRDASPMRHTSRQLCIAYLPTTLTQLRLHDAVITQQPYQGRVTAMSRDRRQSSDSHTAGLLSASASSHALSEREAGPLAPHELAARGAHSGPLLKFNATTGAGGIDACSSSMPLMPLSGAGNSVQGLFSGIPADAAAASMQLRLQRLQLQRCVLDAPLQQLLCSTLRCLDLQEIRSQHGFQAASLAEVAAACPHLQVLKSHTQFGSTVSAFRDADLAAVAGKLAGQLEELEVTIGGLVSAEGLRSLSSLRCLCSLALTLGSVQLAPHATCLTALTRLRRLHLQFSSRGHSELGSGLVVQQLAAALRAGLPDCSVTP